MSRRSIIRDLCKRFTSLYGAIDRTMEKAHIEYESPCKEGCAHCCFQLPTISIAEGLLIADFLYQKKISRPTRHTIYREIQKRTDLIMKKKITIVEWWRQQIPCVFLDDSSLCRVYEVRPVACRSQMVVKGSDCSFGDGNTKRILMVDSKKMLNSGMEEAARLSRELNIPIGYAPFPVAMLWAFSVYDLGVEHFKRTIKGTIFEDDSAAGAHWVKSLDAKERGVPYDQGSQRWISSPVGRREETEQGLQDKSGGQEETPTNRILQAQGKK